MPNIWTHLIFGQELMNQLGHANMLSDKQLRHVFSLGCQGPDFLFYHNFLPWKKDKKLNELGSLMHTKACGPFPTWIYFPICKAEACIILLLFMRLDSLHTIFSTATCIPMFFTNQASRNGIINDLRSLWTRSLFVASLDYRHGKHLYGKKFMLEKLCPSALFLRLLTLLPFTILTMHRRLLTRIGMRLIST